MSRPRKASDDDIFAAIYRVMQRVRPGDLTLAEVGKEAGVTAGALVQRFGSKQGMMRALNERFADSTKGMLDGIRAAASSPLGAIRAYAECFAGMIETPATLAHHLAYLEMDLSDPEMYAQVSKHQRETRTAMRRWVREAIAAGELAKTANVNDVARAVLTMVGGSMMSYPFFREGTPKAWLRADLELALKQYLPRR
jgi:AcrR family transcriptional regulator